MELCNTLSSINTNLNLKETFKVWEVTNVTMPEQHQANEMKTRDMESAETLEEKKENVQNPQEVTA